MKFSEMPYERIDFDAVKEELSSIIKAFQEAGTPQEQMEVHRRYYKLMGRIKTQATLAEIRHSIDTTDPFYEEEKTYYDQEMPAFSNQEVQYKKLLFASPYRKELELVIGGPAFKNIELAAKSVSEAVIPLMQEENALVTEYEKLLAGAKIDWKGKLLNLSMMTPYLNHEDREIRKKAAAKVNAFYEGIADQLDELYDKLVKNRTAQAKKLGFETYTDLGYCRMNRNSYGRKEVEQFREQIKKDWVPFAEKMWENRRKRLGLDTLYHMDEGLSFPEGSPKPTGTPEEILKSGQKMYEELSPETREFFDFMMEGDLFDVFARPHKQVGGYMTYLPDYHAPFIFANFNGTAGDVDVVTHECGHAFQGYLLRDEEIREFADITMETAEIHSMSMEYFAYNWMELFFGDRKDDYLKMHLEDSAAFVPYGCMVDEFQHIVYEKPEMTPAERKAVWAGLEKVYRPHMDYEEDPFFGQGGFWQKQPHIFGSPFYYIDYAVSRVGALEYYGKMQEDLEGAWKDYYALCSQGGSKGYHELLRIGNLSDPFKEGTIYNVLKKLNLI